MPCCQGQDFDRMFDARRARKDLRTYSKRGARGATRRLLDAVMATVRERGTADFTHLHIGGSSRRSRLRTGRSTVCAPRKGSTWIGMIPGCGGAYGSTDGEPPDCYAVESPDLHRRAQHGQPHGGALECRWTPVTGIGAGVPYNVRPTGEMR
jgi:hypothetical protein